MEIGFVEFSTQENRGKAVNYFEGLLTAYCLLHTAYFFYGIQFG